MKRLEEETKELLNNNNIEIIKHNFYNGITPDIITNNNFIIECKESRSQDNTNNIQLSILSLAGKRYYIEKMHNDLKYDWILIIKSNGYTGQMLTTGFVCLDYVIPYELKHLIPMIINKQIDKEKVFIQVLDFIYTNVNNKANFKPVYNFLTYLEKNTNCSLQSITDSIKCTYGYASLIKKILLKHSIIKEELNPLNKRMLFIDLINKNWRKDFLDICSIEQFTMYSK
jgi:hypothetical protein